MLAHAKAAELPAEKEMHKERTVARTLRSLVKKSFHL